MKIKYCDLWTRAPWDDRDLHGRSSTLLRRRQGHRVRLPDVGNFIHPETLRPDTSRISCGALPCPPGVLVCLVVPTRPSLRWKTRSTVRELAARGLERQYVGLQHPEEAVANLRNSSIQHYAFKQLFEYFGR